MITDNFLDEARDVPSTTPMERVVAWSIFRSREDARKLLDHVHLAPGQALVGGQVRTVWPLIGGLVCRYRT